MRMPVQQTLHTCITPYLLTLKTEDSAYAQVNREGHARTALLLHSVAFKSATQPGFDWAFYCLQLFLSSPLA